MSATEEASGGKGGGGHPHEFHIKIDRDQFTTTRTELTGSELRALPTPPIGNDRDLFLAVPGGSDRKILDDTMVPMKDGLRFFTAPAQINPGR
jgi:hypothetical protein